jgi:digeranylgeranylglycerophospholipid reductase
MKSKCDVLVVGGGPAGLSAAIHAARGGVDVLVVETHNEIGKPLCCAEGISLSGLAQVFEPKDEWICSRVEGVKVFSPSGQSVTIDHPDAGFVLDRTKFEPYLAKLAQNAGVMIETGSRAVSLSLHEDRFISAEISNSGTPTEVEFRVMIAADGIESTIARLAGLAKPLSPADVASCAQYRLEDVEIDVGFPEMHFDPAIAPGGYLWIFPKSPTSANVGLGVVPTLARNVSPFQFLDRFVTKRFSTFRIASKMMGIVPVFQGRRTMLKRNLMAVGDAARLVDSLTGAGIATALLSGKLAGDFAAEYVRNGERLSVLKAYPEEFMRVYGRRLRMYSLAHQIFRRLKASDIDFIIGYANEIFGGRRVRSIDSVAVIRQILARRPSLLKYAGHVVWK